MSESTDMIRRAYDAWHRDGIEAFIEFWAEDVRWRSIEGAPDDRGPMRGRAEIRSYLEDWMETFDQFHVDVLDLVETDEGTVVASLSYGGRARHSGIEVPDTPLAAVFVIRDGRISAGGEYESQAEAFDAARLFANQPD
jgi:ketosteroid isomerase-like protein